MPDRAAVDATSTPPGVAPSTIQIVEVDDRSAAEWTTFVESYPTSTLYHDYRWRQVIHRSFGRKSHYLCAVDSKGEVQGVLPLVRLESFAFGDFLVSLPYFNYGGVVARSDEVLAALKDAAGALGGRLGVDHVEFRHVDDLWPDLPKRTDKVAMVLPLPSDLESLGRQLGSKLRSQIKRPVKEGAEIRLGGAELVDDFYGVFARNMRDLGTPVYAKRFFAEIAAAFPSQVLVAVVRLGGKPVAAGFVLRHRQRAEIPWAASLREANPYGVNMYLYGSLLEWCVTQGVREFDFGRSTVDAGTYRFKRQWGAVPVPLYWHYWLPTGRALPQISPDNPKYRLFVAAWQRLPVAIANRIGPHLVKNLP